MNKLFIAKRIKEERERCNLRQDDVAKYMEWDSSKHSIVVELEAGRRELKAWELYKLAQLFHMQIEDFFKESTTIRPLILWRNKPDVTALLKERQFIQRCEDYKFLEDLLGEKLPVKRNLPKHNLDIKTATSDWANEIADVVRNELNLGDFPATTLPRILEENYGVRFMALPLGNDGSAACSIYDFGPAILLNSDEVSWRQSFSVAHDLFHLITWNEKVFKQFMNSPDLDKRNEQLANAFAAGLLMPENSLRQQIRRLCEDEKLKFSSLVALAREHRVSTSALLYRLEYLGFLSKKVVEKTRKDKIFRSLDKQSFPKAHENATQIGDRFIRLAYLAYQFSKISRSRLARLLNVSLITLESHLNVNGFSEIDNEEISLSHS